uniref:Uncharacterized protein n=1 Tax=Oryza meridionalis TaxID=40149 RepID=A0A0E0F3R9_9ORYZ
MAVAAEPTDGPTLSVVSKWLHALRKKHNKIIQMEEPLTNGRKLNKEQEEVPQSKPIIVVLIDELERMRAPLATALTEELSSRPARSPSVVASSSSSVDLSIEDLLALIYFGSLFDNKLQTEFVATMLMHAKEWDCYITFDYVRPCRLTPCRSSVPPALVARQCGKKTGERRKKGKKEEMDGKRDTSGMETRDHTILMRRRKKHNKILQMKESLADGRKLNKKQEEVL